MTGKKIRIVGGEMMVTAKGDYSMYATESNIDMLAGKKVVAKGLNDGVVYKKFIDPPPMKIVPQCMVMFRPHANWKGEFGFDWFRGGDSGMDTDKSFMKIVGKHYTDGTFKTVFPDTNSWSIFFDSDWKMYDKILRTYKCYTVPWKKKVYGNAYLYTVPIMTMLKGEKHRLTLRVEIKTKPDKLFLRQQKNMPTDIDYFTFSKKDIPIKAGNYALENFVDITCTKSFKKDQIIEVVANDEVCGWLKILANDVSRHKHIPIVVVPVQTTGGVGKMVSNGEAFFKQGLKQAYVFANGNTIERTKFPLNLTATSFDGEYTSAGNIKSSSGKTTGQSMLAFLDNQLEISYPKKYTNHYKLYFVANTYPVVLGPGITGIVQGFSNFKTLHGVYFSGHDRSTVTHETLHAIGLAHTFDGIAPEAKFTYKAQQTDNLMDYCHWGVDIQGNPRKAVEGRTLFRWQMIALNGKLNNTH